MRSVGIARVRADGHAEPERQGGGPAHGVLVTRVASVPSNFSGFMSAGTSIAERVVRWERNGDRVMLRTIGYGAYADDSLPIAISVASNNLGPIIAAFPIQAFTRDSASFVLDVTDFFAGDTPALSGLDAAARRTYQVRRLDPARSFVNTVRSFPLNVEVRHTQTFDAAAPPSDPDAGTVSLEMRQSLVLLPKEPMRPRYADERIGFFTVGRVNYGLDEQKAAMVADAMDPARQADILSYIRFPQLSAVMAAVAMHDQIRSGNVGVTRRRSDAARLENSREKRMRCPVCQGKEREFAKASALRCFGHGRLQRSGCDPETPCRSRHGCRARAGANRLGWYQKGDPCVDCPPKG